jgi:hypothetical protein
MITPKVAGAPMWQLLAETPYAQFAAEHGFNRRFAAVPEPFTYVGSIFLQRTEPS